MRQSLETEQKALEINLDPVIYGAFAEIGAGQEVARIFFRVGAAAGTIAKTMSAYDKLVSDDIYGPEPSGRYVCESRLDKMLDHEWELLERRLRAHRPNDCFFVFADTVSALNFHRTNIGQGWLGLRFQLAPGGEPNDLVLHVKMLDNDPQLQQQAVGILGVNLIYACFRYQNDPETLLLSLGDSLKGRATIDLVRLTGPDFQQLDNRLLSLWLVKHDLSDVAMFGPDRRNVHASEFLYKKHVLVVRSPFRPMTLVNEDMILKSVAQLRREPDVDATNSFLLAEMTMDNLLWEGSLDEQDFLARSEVLCDMGQTVMVSDCEQYQRLVAYLSDYKIRSLGIVLRSRHLLQFLREKYEQTIGGKLLSAFGEVFTGNVRLYVYPSPVEGSEELMTAQNLPLPEGLKFLYRHLLDNLQIVDIQDFDAKILNVYSTNALQMLREGKTGWEALVPEKVAASVKEKSLFGYSADQLEF